MSGNSPLDQDGGWKPIATAPQTKGKYFFCRLAWGPEWDICTGDGFRWNNRWFAAGSFYKGGPSDTCQYEIRQVEVSPTHWMFAPFAPEVSA